ncbi:hypothetical protein OC834_008030, partial [Tilletia horrida]
RRLLNRHLHSGSSAFKGCIAAFILVPLFGLAFQAILQHRAAAGKLGFFGIWGGGGALGTRGKDADEEWNDILGAYTQHYEKGVRELVAIHAFVQISVLLVSSAIVSSNSIPYTAGTNEPGAKQWEAGKRPPAAQTAYSSGCCS